MARAHSPSRRRAGDFGREPHNHQHCIDDALDRAAALCEQRGSRLTDIRRRVLELVWRNHAPVGAYALLDEIRKDGRIAAPPTVYRALDFLREQGLVHRLESLNAFIGCPKPESSHEGQFLICDGCGVVREFEAPAIRAAIARQAGAYGFAIHQQTIEARGTCRECRGTAGS